MQVSTILIDTVGTGEDEVPQEQRERHSVILVDTEHSF